MSISCYLKTTLFWPKSIYVRPRGNISIIFTSKKTIRMFFLVVHIQLFCQSAKLICNILLLFNISLESKSKDLLHDHWPRGSVLWMSPSYPLCIFQLHLGDVKNATDFTYGFLGHTQILLIIIFCKITCPYSFIASALSVLVKEISLDCMQKISYFLEGFSLC